MPASQARAAAAPAHGRIGRSLRARLAALIVCACLCSASATQAAAATRAPGADPAGPMAESVGGIFGFNEDAVDGVNGVGPAEHVGLVRAVGGNAIRTNLDWRNAEPWRDNWDERWWERWRELYGLAIARGVTPIFIIGSAPWWAQRLVGACDRYRACERPPSREMDGEWAEYAREVARRFPEAIVEVWNEPNLHDFWRPGANPERFAELVAIAHAAIKQQSPRTPVAAGGVLNLRRTTDRDMSLREFLTRAYRAEPSIAGRADYVGLHPYPSRARIGKRSRFARAVRLARRIQRSAGDARTPLLITEVGVSTAHRGVGEARQARVLLRMHERIGEMRGVSGVVYHRLVEPYETTPHPLEIGYAWLRHGSSPLAPRPVYCRFVAAAGRSYPGCG